MRLSWLENAYLVFTPTFFRQAIMTHKVGQTDLVFMYNESTLVSLRMQDYKCLCAVVTMCSTLVNIHTHTDTQTAFDQLI